MLLVCSVLAALGGGGSPDADLGGLSLPLALAETEPQVVNPADAQKKGGQDRREPSTKMIEREQEVVVIAGALMEEYAVGETRQPEWTTHRRWAATRVYVQQPAGGVEFEQWFEIRTKKDGGEPHEVRIKQELEFGLGDRLQLDLYAMSVWTQNRGSEPEDASTFDWRGFSAEIRYALADWDEIWGNPTLYFEYQMLNESADVFESKLLLGGTIDHGWYWGSNLVWERGLGNADEIEIEYKVTLGISHTLIDRKLSLGVSAEAAYVVEPGGRAREVHVGPSLQYRPIPRAHFDIEPLWGCTGESKRLKMFLVFGWDF